MSMVEVGLQHQAELENLLVISRLVLTLVFIVAGLAKLADRAGSRQAIIEFGVPASLVIPLMNLLPVAELTIAVALISSTFAWWGAVGALVLLVVFTVAISIHIARGRTPQCHCFGQLRSGPVGLQALIRNEMLAAVAGLVVWQGWSNAGPNIMGWLGNLAPSRWLSLIMGLILLALWTVRQTFAKDGLSQDRRLQGRPTKPAMRAVTAASVTPTVDQLAVAPVAGLPIGARAPTFDLSVLDLDAERLTLDTLRTIGKPVMLIFSDPVCSPCGALLAEISRWQREHAASLTIALVSRGGREANHANRTGYELTNVLLQQDNEMGQAYGVMAIPAAVMVQADGTIGSRLALGGDAIRSLLMGKVGR